MLRWSLLIAGAIVIGFVFILIFLGLKDYVSVKQTTAINDPSSVGNDQIYQHNLDIATQSVLENQQATQEVINNPSVYQAISVAQTQDFIGRIDKALSDNSNIDLNFTPDIAVHSREFNSLNDEAEHIYGSSDIDDPYRSCINAATTARQIWSNVYSNSSLSKEYIDKTKKRDQMAYLQYKQSCLDDVANKTG